jgi:predicted HTH transcriptional regulator
MVHVQLTRSGPGFDAQAGDHLTTGTNMKTTIERIELASAVLERVTKGDSVEIRLDDQPLTAAEIEDVKVLASWVGCYPGVSQKNVIYRGGIASHCLELLAEHGPMNTDELSKRSGIKDRSVHSAMGYLVKSNLVSHDGSKYALKAKKAESPSGEARG